jgi:prepilin-type N-terminal cleavage/methylation domain-containing protein
MTDRGLTNICRLGNPGFTLVELVIVIVVLGIVAAVAIPHYGNLTEGAKINTTKSEMQTIIQAITGNARLIAGGEYVDCGFEGDVGFVPSRLQDLITKPDSIPPYDKFTRRGWNGPYLDSTGGVYLTDAWSVPYLFDPATRTLTSTATEPNIVMSF